MRLSALIKGLRIKKIDGDAEIYGLSTDSRTVKMGDLFFAMKGFRYDGNDFIEDAINRGAVAVVSEDDGIHSSRYAHVQVEDIEDALAFISSRFYESPSERLTLIGITGTNGKTTTSYLIREIFRAAGKQTGLIGTVKYLVKDREIKANLTTPMAVQFQGLLKDMVEEGVEVAIAEVSSHALSLKRVDYSRFRACIFTNLSRDHLDYHGNMDDYFAAKRRLFIDLQPDISIVNTDDPYGKMLFEELTKDNRVVISYGLDGSVHFKAEDITQKKDGMEFHIINEKENIRFRSPLIGLVNVYNILASVALAKTLGVDWYEIKEAVSQFTGVRGRLETVYTEKGFLAVVDYAHTPDALRKVLETLRSISSGRLITLFGCGGDRDRGKRPEMGAIASELSDLVIITSDNPRSEPPESIIDDIKKGIKKNNYIIEPDRRKAIFKAAGMARKGDILLLAGKGHEDYQEIKGVRYKFNDREVFEEAISSLKEAGT
ncbi:MAG: UDP-N-acetylmuramoyl-L-alanyl-D-glutamate--2,6-diaminopimelate ligase [Nitrospirae bacterium]|nr:UDP-N-acetylmuramoyl-L-alanyl-D-glutamate--2,6-diaminopimelate ligase [Nitrospirota bacterium]